VVEASWEPRLAFIIPLKFIDNLILAINKSIISWQQRLNLEKMRQGLFQDTNEANKYGWHELRITVHGAKLSLNPRNISYDRGKSSVSLVALTPVDGQSYINSGDSNALNSSTEYNTSLRIDSQKFESFAKRIPLHTNSSKLADKPRRIDESLPSTFVNITVIDRLAQLLVLSISYIS